jgi:hypothetical protein
MNFENNQVGEVQEFILITKDDDSDFDKDDVHLQKKKWV